MRCYRKARDASFVHPSPFAGNSRDGGSGAEGIRQGTGSIYCLATALAGILILLLFYAIGRRIRSRYISDGSVLFIEYIADSFGDILGLQVVLA